MEMKKNSKNSTDPRSQDQHRKLWIRVNKNYRTKNFKKMSQESKFFFAGNLLWKVAGTKAKCLIKEGVRYGKISISACIFQNIFEGVII